MSGRSTAKPSEDYPFHLLVYYELYPDIFGTSPDRIAGNAYLIKAIRDQVDLDQPLGPLEFSFRERGTNRILTANLQYMTYQTGDFPYAIIMPSAEHLLAELRDPCSTNRNGPAAKEMKNLYEFELRVPKAPGLPFQTIFFLA